MWDSPEEAEQFWNLYRVYMDHRPTHQAVVDDLVGEQVVLRWAAEGAYVRLSRDGDQVMILIGPDQVSVDELVSAFEE